MQRNPNRTLNITSLSPHHLNSKQRNLSYTSQTKISINSMNLQLCSKKLQRQSLTTATEHHYRPNSTTPVSNNRNKMKIQHFENEGENKSQKRYIPKKNTTTSISNNAFYPFYPFYQQRNKISYNTINTHQNQQNISNIIQTQHSNKNQGFYIIQNLLNLNKPYSPIYKSAFIPFTPISISNTAKKTKVTNIQSTNKNTKYQDIIKNNKTTIIGTKNNHHCVTNLNNQQEQIYQKSNKNVNTLNIINTKQQLKYSLSKSQNTCEDWKNKIQIQRSSLSPLVYQSTLLKNRARLSQAKTNKSKLSNNFGTNITVPIIETTKTNIRNIKSLQSLFRSNSAHSITPKGTLKTSVSNILQKQANKAKNINLKSQVVVPSIIKNNYSSPSKNNYKLTTTSNFLFSTQNLSQKIPEISQEIQAQDLPSSTLIPNDYFDNIKNNKLQLDNFQIIEKIGKGTFGNVFLARQKSTEFICVIKSLSKSQIKKLNLQQYVLRQIKIQFYLQHKHLAKLYGFFDDENKIYLVMEYMPDGSSLQIYKKRAQKQVAGILRQVCSGLAYMHKQNVLHRDIKPENLLLYQGYVKICDFGCSIHSSTMRDTIIGCAKYFSPEQISQQPYNDKIDVWNVGILAYQLLLGKYPFEQQLRKKNIKRIQYIPEISFSPKQLSSTAINFIQKLLVNNPKQRCTIKQALKHPFLKIEN